VHKEIRKVRIGHICTLLAETDLSIQQNTMDMEFTGIEHIARYFYKEKGMSLREFRKNFGKNTPRYDWAAMIVFSNRSYIIHCLY
jgi:AraC-like DNA-binding protein